MILSNIVAKSRSNFTSELGSNNLDSIGYNNQVSQMLPTVGVQMIEVRLDVLIGMIRLKSC